MRTFGLASIGLALFVACSNGNNNGDGGADSGGDAPGNTFTQTGQVIAFGGTSGVADVIISAAGSSATTDVNGNYSLSVPQNMAYTTQFAAAPDAGGSYVSLDEQEWMLTGDANRGKTSFVSTQLEGILKGILGNPNPMLAVLSVIVEATGTCAADAGGSDVTGATISVPGMAADGGSGGPVLTYFAGSPSLPSASATSVTAGQLPSAIIYNLPLNAAFSQITVTHPTCHQVAFPVTDPSAPTIKYTGNVKLEASEPTTGPQVVSNIRIFLD